MTLEEEIQKQEEKAMTYKSMGNRLSMNMSTEQQIRAMEYYHMSDYHKQFAELLRELKTYREFADWLVKAVLEEDWEESADFYAEVLCRKLTKLGKLKVVDNKYMEVNADEDSD